MVKREIVKVTIDGIKFEIQEFNWKQSLQIQKDVLIILSPVLDVLGINKKENEENSDNSSFLDKIEINKLGSSIKSSLMSIEDPFEFFKKIFFSTYVIMKNKEGKEGGLCLDNDDILNEVFHKKTITAFKLVFEILKANELLFSKGLGGLGKTIGTLMSTM